MEIQEEVEGLLQCPAGEQEWSTLGRAGSYSAVVGIRRAVVDRRHFCKIVFHSYWLY